MTDQLTDREKRRIEEAAILARAANDRLRLVVRAVAIVAAIVIFGVTFFAVELVAANQRIQDGRRVGSATVCTVVSGVIQGGQKTIMGTGSVGPSELERFLQQHGLPPRSVRVQGGRLAAEQYRDNINARVQKRTGIHDLINPDGSLDCAKLKKASKV